MFFAEKQGKLIKERGRLFLASERLEIALQGTNSSDQPSQKVLRPQEAAATSPHRLCLQVSMPSCSLSGQPTAVCCEKKTRRPQNNLRTERHAVSGCTTTPRALRAGTGVALAADL